MGETCRHDEPLDQPTRGEAWKCFTKMGLGLCKKIEKGYFGNLTKYRLGDLLPTHDVRRCVEKRIRSRGDEAAL